MLTCASSCMCGRLKVLGGKLQGIPMMMITGAAVKVQKVLEAVRWALQANAEIHSYTGKHYPTFRPCHPVSSCMSFFLVLRA